MKNVGLMIKDLRIKAGMSQRKLASASGISNAEISRIEAGMRSNINYEVLYKLLSVLESTSKIKELCERTSSKIYEMMWVQKKMDGYNIDLFIEKCIEELIEDEWSIDIKNSQSGIISLRKVNGETLGLKFVLGHSLSSMQDMDILLSHYIECIEKDSNELNSYEILIDNKEAYEVYKANIRGRFKKNIKFVYINI